MTPLPPDKPRQYSSKAKNAQEAHEAIRPTDFNKDRAASGDHARLYQLVFNRRPCDQMASARLERTTVELADGPGRATLRATGQVTIFPGYLALYEEGRDEKADDEDGARMPALRSGDAPVKTGVEERSASPSRRRAIQRQVSSSGWRNWGSAAHRPMPRRFRP